MMTALWLLLDNVGVLQTYSSYVDMVIKASDLRAAGINTSWRMVEVFPPNSSALH